MYQINYLKIPKKFNLKTYINVWLDQPPRTNVIKPFFHSLSKLECFSLTSFSSRFLQPLQLSTKIRELQTIFNKFAPGDNRT